MLLVHVTSPLSRSTSVNVTVSVQIHVQQTSRDGVVVVADVLLLVTLFSESLFSKPPLPPPLLLLLLSRRCSEQFAHARIDTGSESLLSVTVT